MEKRSSILLPVLFVISFLSFQQLIAAKSFDSDESDIDETTAVLDSLDTGDRTIPSESNLVTEEETRLYPEDIFNSTSDDIIHLNVGGQMITTYRSTLTAVPYSKLALMFAKDNQNKTKTRNDMKPYFFDYNPVQFEYLLNQLRALKRMPEKAAYELVFQSPIIDIKFNFSDMLTDLGLNAERFLSPLVGTHVDLKVNSLIGWKLCYLGKYNLPFNASIFADRCKGKRLLVACRSNANKKVLTVAGVGRREDLFQPCSHNSYCSTMMFANTGFYYAQNQAWGFYGRPKDPGAIINQYDSKQYSGSGSVHLNPCDSSDEYPEYRLCWSLRSSANRGGGDRCGSLKNLHNIKGWERVIYETA